MVTIDQTRKKYHGRKAETYDAIRVRQARWDIENSEVERMLRALKPHSVLDCPVGTGRFLRMYDALEVGRVWGVDTSTTMLALARKKVPSRMRKYVELTQGDATALYEREFLDKDVTVAVCVRFLDLIDEEAMRSVVRELCRVARRAVILTIRLGDVYVNKSNTATHSRKKFFALVNRLGWSVLETVPVLRAGWTIVRLGRD